MTSSHSGKLTLVESGDDVLQARLDFDQSSVELLKDHRVHGVSMLPGTFHVELALLVWKTWDTSERPVEVSNVRFHQPLLMADQDNPSLSVHLTRRADGWQYECFRCKEGSRPDLETPFASMRVGTRATADDCPEEIPLLVNLSPDDSSIVQATDFYSHLSAVGNNYGPAFQRIGKIQVDHARRQAVAQLLSSGEGPSSSSEFDPMLLDACVQCASSLRGDRREAYVLMGIDSIRFGLSSGLPAAIYATHVDIEADNELTADVFVVSEDGAVVTALRSVHLRFLEDGPGDQRTSRRSGVGIQHQARSETDSSELPRTPIGLAATFTSEPVEESLRFWGGTLATSLDVEFAPYNQVFQQLLDPNGVFARTDGGLNVILLRLEDWIGEGHRVDVQVGEEQKAELLRDQSVRQLAGGLDVAQINAYETDYVYKEIFVDRCYMKHGIELKDGDTVIDIGANIGLFSLFVQQECRDSRVLCFDPSPPVFEALRRNVALYGASVKAFNCGLSDCDGEATFTYYEKSSVFSSFHADAREDEAAVREVVVNMLTEGGLADPEQRDRYVDELMADRMNSTPYTCQLRTLSSVIREEGLDRIDLLKVDAEKSELQILQGIDDEHWPLIKQIVIEVHDRQGPLIESVRRMLLERGFELAIEEENLLQNSGLYNLFATRGDAASSPLSTDRRKETLYRTEEEFKLALSEAAARSATPWIVGVCPSSPQSTPEWGGSFCELEADLAAAFANTDNVHLIRPSEIERSYPVAQFYDPDGDRLGHVPYSREYFAALGSGVARRFDAIRRPPYKVIVLDCDNTLWKGQAGEGGPTSVDPSGPFQLLQEFMVQQADAGMLLCLCSKNVEEDVQAVFDARPEMPLSDSRIVARRVNWQTKSANLVELAAELNLGLESFIFVDDNPIECAEVSASLPQVLTLQLPADPAEIPAFLQHVWAFDQLLVTAEDRNRTSMYQQNIARQQYQDRAITLAEFLDGLQLEVRIEAPHTEQWARVAQLTQRTNQFNFTTLRRSEAEINRDRQAGLDVLVVTVRDRFGDYGLVGEMFFREVQQALEVDTFLLSCRVLGRGVEHRMLAELGRVAQQRGLESVRIQFHTTAKNQPALDFLESEGAAFQHEQDGCQLFEFPAEVAKKLSYQPEAAGRENGQRHSSAANTDEPANIAVDFQRTPPYQRIATELRQVDDILQQVAGAHSVQRQVAEQYVAPASGLQRSIADIWRTVLSVDQVGVNDNFRDLGGTSLRAVQLIVQLKRDLGFDLAIVDLFENPTISSLARMLGDGPAATSEKAKDRGAQRREKRRVRRRRK